MLVVLTDLSSEQGKLGSALMGLELRNNDDDVDGDEDGDDDGEEDNNHNRNYHHHHHDKNHHIRLRTHGIRASPQGR